MAESELKTFLGRLADVASEAILPHFRKPMMVEHKGGAIFDPVTAADRAAEGAMRRLIEETYPEDGIVGEELGERRPDAARIWVLDPIDGTRSFIAGLPVWGTLIGLRQGPKPILGMMAQPFTGERFLGDGRNAWYSGPGGERNLRTRPCSELSQAILFTTSPFLFSAEEQVLYRRVEAASRLARYGCDCYAYAMLASGHVDIVLEAGLAEYDILALIPLIEGAGGQVTNWQGGSAAKGGQVLATGDARIHEAALTLLNG